MKVPILAWTTGGDYSSEGADDDMSGLEFQINRGPK